MAAVSSSTAPVCLLSTARATSFCAGRSASGKLDGLVDATANLTEEVHVLDLLGREVRERVEPVPIVDLEVTGERDHFRCDEFLHVAEQVSVSSQLHVAELRLLLRAERRDRIGTREPRGQPALRRVELASVEDVADLPVDPVGVLQAVRV